jgi:hypothetical protein
LGARLEALALAAAGATAVFFTFNAQGDIAAIAGAAAASCFALSINLARVGWARRDGTVRAGRAASIGAEAGVHRRRTFGSRTFTDLILFRSPGSSERDIQDYRAGLPLAMTAFVRFETGHWRQGEIHTGGGKVAWKPWRQGGLEAKEFGIVPQDSNRVEVAARPPSGYSIVALGLADDLAIIAVPAGDVALAQVMMNEL